MTLEWTLKEAGLDVKSDLTIDTSIAFASMSGAFIGGTGDFVSLFEPNALQIEKQGYGYVVASLGELGGVVPYTAYNAKKSYIENNKLITIIKDNGHGMDKETIDNLFTPFYSKKSFGTGLGLCLSKEIIELHNGTIKYTSKLNLYTEVKIVIPVY